MTTTALKSADTKEHTLSDRGSRTKEDRGLAGLRPKQGRTVGLRDGGTSDVGGGVGVLDGISV